MLKLWQLQSFNMRYDQLAFAHNFEYTSFSNILIQIFENLLHKSKHMKKGFGKIVYCLMCCATSICVFCLITIFYNKQVGKESKGRQLNLL